MIRKNTYSQTLKYKILNTDLDNEIIQIKEVELYGV